MPQTRLSCPRKFRCRGPIALLAGGLAITLAACGKPPAPERERPPEPQASSSELREAIHAPIDRANAVEADVLEAADAQREAIDAATGG